MDTLKISDNLSRLAKLLSPVKLYAVGGFVRSSLLGCQFADIDICSPQKSAEIKEKTEGTDFFITAEYPRTGTLKIKCGNEDYEYSSFRKDIYAGDGSHTPARVEFCTDIESDAKRRDFTVNAIYYDISENQLCDPLGGIADIKNKIIRAADNPEKVFSSDGLRLLRMVRFACELGFDIEENTLSAAKKYSYLLKDIKSERIAEELMKILLSDLKYPSLTAGSYPHYKGVLLLKECGLLPIILPGIEQCYDVKQRADFHKYDVFMHIANTVKYSNPSVRLASLLHDFGKGINFYKNGNFYGHEESGAEAVRVLLGQGGLKFPKKIVSETELIIKYHMYDLNGATSESKLRWFIVQNIDILPKLLLLKQADYLGSGLKQGISPTVSRWNQILFKMQEENTPFHINELKIGGMDIIGAGCPEKFAGKILDILFRECVFNPEQNTREKLFIAAKREIERLKA